MNAERAGTIALLVAMLALGAASWWMQLRPALRVEASRLQTLPMALDGWQGRDIPLEDAVERMLEADANVQRAYLRDGERIWLYVGYYGTQRGGRPEHTPEQCYPSGGWAIVSDGERLLDPARGRRANQLVVESGGARRLVYYWYRSVRRSGLLGGLDVSLDQLRGRLRGERADGALVRVSTPLPPGDAEASAAHARLTAFALQLDDALDTHWPVEFE